jgi:hypothetical protein
MRRAEVPILGDPSHKPIARGIGYRIAYLLAAQVVAGRLRSRPRAKVQKQGRYAMLILLIVLLVVLGGGGGYYGHSRWGYGGGAGIGLGTILLILLVVYMLGGIH